MGNYFFFLANASLNFFIKVHETGRWAHVLDFWAKSNTAHINVKLLHSLFSLPHPLQDH